MHETRGVLKENIISESYFAQLDQKLGQTPNISTVAVSRIVCFINNKTPEYLENISQEEKCKMIMRAIKEASGRKAACRKKKKVIQEKKLMQMREKRKT